MPAQENTRLDTLRQSLDVQIALAKRLHSDVMHPELLLSQIASKQQQIETLYRQLEFAEADLVKLQSLVGTARERYIEACEQRDKTASMVQIELHKDKIAKLRALKRQIAELESSGDVAALMEEMERLQDANQNATT